MKKIALFAIVCATMLLGGCHHETFTINYAIGCVGYQQGSIQESEEEWNMLLNYFETHVELNKIVTFEGKSIAEADKKAKKYFDEQIEKIDETYVCSLLHNTDYYDYGITTQTANGSERNIKVIRFEESGAHELNVH